MWAAIAVKKTPPLLVFGAQNLMRIQVDQIQLAPASVLSFSPHIVVHNSQRVPNPILPVNYGFFLHVSLPANVATLPLRDQLAVMRAATARRRAVPSPFGDIVAFEFRPRPALSIYLNPDAEFSS
jgi:hypothetical protein